MGTIKHRFIRSCVSSVQPDKMKVLFIAVFLVYLAFGASSDKEAKSRKERARPMVFDDDCKFNEVSYPEGYVMPGNIADPGPCYSWVCVANKKLQKPKGNGGDENLIDDIIDIIDAAIDDAINDYADYIDDMFGKKEITGGRWIMVQSKMCVSCEYNKIKYPPGAIKDCRHRQGSGCEEEACFNEVCMPPASNSGPGKFVKVAIECDTCLGLMPNTTTTTPATTTTTTTKKGKKSRRRRK